MSEQDPGQNQQAGDAGRTTGAGSDGGPEVARLLRQLGHLPEVTPEAGAAERTLRRARASFVREAARHERHRRHPLPAWAAAVGRLYSRAEPAVAAGLVLSYLAWAVQTAASLIR